VSRSASFCFSQAKISSILVRTNSARLRLSSGGMGGYLINKFVKQTKIDSRFAHEGCLDQVMLVEAKPDEGTACTRILGEADAAMGQEQSGLNPVDSVFDQSCELLPLFVGNCGPEVLNFDEPLANEDYLGTLSGRTGRHFST
jgi:hypothetical protein